MPPYQVKLKSLAEREAKIRASVQASKETRDFYDFRSQKTALKFVRLAEDLLVYRMENLRTYTEQQQYLIREKKGADYFKTGEETESIQQIQHEILAKLARKGHSDTVVPVLDVLKTEKQREPLLITHKGVAVNGNRRLAAMRELYAEEQATYSEFSHIDCLVLPEDVTAAEIIDIEGALQAKPETRLDYDWIGDALLVQRLLGLGRTAEQVAAKLNRKPGEIKNSQLALAEANLYLSDWTKTPGEYNRVIDAEQLFTDLPSLIQGKDVSLTDASRVIAWSLLDNKNQLSQRLYAFNVTIGKQASDVLDRLSSELGIPLEGETAEDDGSFAVDVEADDGPVSYQPVIEALQERKEDTVEKLIDICRNVVETEKGKKSASAALKSITAANARLTEVELGRARAEDYGAIEKQLDQVMKRAQELQETLTKLKAASASTKPTDKA